MSEQDTGEPLPEQNRGGLRARLSAALARTRASLAGGFARLFEGRREVDAAFAEEVEDLLLSADVGVQASARLVEALRRRYANRRIDDPGGAFGALRAEMVALLEPVAQPLEIPAGRDKPFVILVVGVNGTGKTTTIGKLAHRLLRGGRSVMLAAGDTFRAAAIEQLQAWGARNDVPVVAQQTGADAASVVYDALQSATARGIDVLIADTAGRLHTRGGLMDELGKVARVLGKIDGEAPHEVLLVIDGGTGQNALAQARQFKDAVGVSGVVLTKLDGTARGGIVFAMAEELAIPIRFIGVGEGLEDLREFDAGAFVDALLAR